MKGPSLSEHGANIGGVVASMAGGGYWPAGIERGSRLSQMELNPFVIGCTAKNAPRDPFRLLERRPRRGDRGVAPSAL